MKLTDYQSKCRLRMGGLLTAKGIEIVQCSIGKLNREGNIKTTLCFVLERDTDKDALTKIAGSSQKCFRKCEVFVGKGAHPSFAPEMNYPTLYLTFDK